MSSSNCASAMSIALLLLCISAPSIAGTIARMTADLPDIAAPPGGHAEWVARAMRLNGVPMTIKSFSAHMNTDEVLHHYERSLRTSSDLKTRRTQEGAWQVLSVMDDQYFATIRAKNEVTGTTGTITVTPPLENARPHKHTRFPHPTSAQLVSIQEYEDDGVEAQHLSFVSRRSAVMEANQFVTLLKRHGWQVLRREASSSTGSAYVVEAQNAAALAFIHLRRAEQGGVTTILVVWRRA